MPSVEVEARIKAAEDAATREAVDAAKVWAEAERAEAARKENAAKVAALVHASCSTLLMTDQVAAMTNTLCVDSFLANGLPTP